MVYDTAKLLAGELKNSAEYREYNTVKVRAMENKTTRALIEEYNKLQIQAQAAMIAGDKDSEALKKLQRIGEVLQFDADASAYLTGQVVVNDGGLLAK